MRRFFSGLCSGAAIAVARSTGMITWHGYIVAVLVLLAVGFLIDDYYAQQKAVR